jgi:hypothetical protein
MIAIRTERHPREESRRSVVVVSGRYMAFDLQRHGGAHIYKESRPPFDPLGLAVRRPHRSRKGRRPRVSPELTRGWRARRWALCAHHQPGRAPIRSASPASPASGSALRRILRPLPPRKRPQSWRGIRSHFLRARVGLVASPCTGRQPTAALLEQEARGSSATVLSVALTDRAFSRDGGRERPGHSFVPLVPVLQPFPCTRERAWVALPRTHNVSRIRSSFWPERSCPARLRVGVSSCWRGPHARAAAAFPPDGDARREPGITGPFERSRAYTREVPLSSLASHSPEWAAGTLPRSIHLVYDRA